eukprot:3534373-Amphidinium_carterae.1
MAQSLKLVKKGASGTHPKPAKQNFSGSPQKNNPPGESFEPHATQNPQYKLCVESNMLRKGGQESTSLALSLDKGPQPVRNTVLARSASPGAVPQTHRIRWDANPGGCESTRVSRTGCTPSAPGFVEGCVTAAKSMTCKGMPDDINKAYMLEGMQQSGSVKQIANDAIEQN